MSKLSIVIVVPLFCSLLAVMTLVCSCGGGGGGGGAASWAKSYGGAGTEEAYSIQQTSDGGYIMAGYAIPTGNSDFWVLKLNSGSAISWQKTYGDAGNDDAYSIQQTSDGGYIVAGETKSFSDANGDAWVLKLNSNGTVEWQKSYGGVGDEDYAYSIQQTSDGGYIVAGDTLSFGAGGCDAWVFKLDSDGTIDWQKAYGGADWDRARSIQETSDGYIVAGDTTSFGSGDYDFWVLKLNSTGTVTWQKVYGGGGADNAHSIQQTSDGGYIVAGWASSFGAGGYDFWVLKLNSDGTVDWQKAYGGTNWDFAYSIQQTSDGGYIVAGDTKSFGDVNGDVWVLKLNSDGSVAWEKTYSDGDVDVAHSIQQTSDGRYILAGHTDSFGAGWSDFWVLKLNSNGTISFNAVSGAQVIDTSATVTNTSASVTTTTATVTNTTANQTITTVTPVDTDATVEQQAP